MSFFKLKVSGEVYELDRLTLGEAQTLKHEFGLESLTSFSGTDPDQIVGLLYLALRRREPALSHQEVLDRVQDLDVEGFEAVEESADPPSAVENNSQLDGNSTGEHGSPETTPVTAGTQD